MKSAWGFSGTLLTLACVCLAQGSLALPATAASQDDKDCNPTTVATTGEIGGNFKFRDKIMIRGIKSNAGWVTACPVPLNMPAPNVGTNCEEEPLVSGKNLLITEKKNGRLEVSIRDGKQTIRSGEAQQWNLDGETSEGGTWLEMIAKGNSGEERYYVMMLDYTGVAIPGLASIPKFYMVEAFDMATAGNAACQKEMPSRDNIIQFDPGTGETIPQPAKKRNAKADNRKILEIKQTDTGAGGEPGKRVGAT